MTNLVAILGETLATGLQPSQRVEVIAAIDESETGVRREAAAILADRTVTSPIGAFMHRIHSGAHRRRDPSDERKRRHELTAIDMAERRYRAHRGRYPHLGHRQSLEYAVDTTIIDHRSAGLDSRELETALNERLRGAA